MFIFKFIQIATRFYKKNERSPEDTYNLWLYIPKYFSVIDAFGSRHTLIFMGIFWESVYIYIIILALFCICQACM
jgi:hypothetical protein